MQSQYLSAEGPQRRIGKWLKYIYILAICANASDPASVHTSIITRANARDMQNRSTSTRHIVRRLTLSDSQLHPRNTFSLHTHSQKNTLRLYRELDIHTGDSERTRTLRRRGCRHEIGEKFFRPFPSRPPHFSRAHSTGKSECLDFPSVPLRNLTMMITHQLHCGWAGVGGEVGERCERWKLVKIG